MVCLGQPGLLEAVDVGLKWLVIAGVCDTTWPLLCDLVQGSLNTTSRQDQSEIEVILEMRKLHVLALKKGQEVNWSSIQKQACSQSPPCQMYVADLCTYVQKQAGELLLELSTFMKTIDKNQVNAVRPFLGSEFWQKLNSLSWGKVEKMPHLLHACICAALAAPQSKIVDGMCRLTPATLLRTLVQKSNVEKCREAEAFLTSIRTSVAAMGVPQSKSAKCIGRADCRVIYMLTKKGKESAEGKAYESIQEIAQVVPTYIRQLL